MKKKGKNRAPIEPVQDPSFQSNKENRSIFIQ